ncbi:hypothetical protein SASPL_106036 [Salvia splendens]|uniref:WRKY domain-containing protein n=1 Tax=Salvia splendens TaxID=180675 RepID=A0A8X8YM46_SALSN|nr:hypothetical protein SASPL_106036 [Salvia splendens]
MIGTFTPWSEAARPPPPPPKTPLVLRALLCPKIAFKAQGKHQSKKVCHVPAESVSSDVWSWRKYGQKPIKGSPYPSTLKGCMARKQVERNKSDPGKFIITYTGDHTHLVPTHRNSLAGSTRSKPDSKKPEESEVDIDDDDFFSGLDDLGGEGLPESPATATAEG